MGWTNKELLASPFTQFILKDDVKKTVRVMQNLTKGQSVINFTNRYKTKDGGIKWIEWTSTPDMVTKLIFTIGRDVTEFVKREQLLMKSEQKFSNLFDNVEGILSISDLKGNFIDVNPAGLAAAGYTREEMKQTSLFDIVAPETYNEIKEYIAAVEKYGHASGEMNIIKKSGEKAIWYFMSTLDEDYEGNNRVLTNVIDITERNKLNEELTQAKEEAEKALKIKTS